MSGGAIFGSIYKVTRPTVLAPYAAIGWFVVGLVVAMLVRGRPRPVTPSPTSANARVCARAPGQLLTLQA